MYTDPEAFYLAIGVFCFIFRKLLKNLFLFIQYSVFICCEAVGQISAGKPQITITKDVILETFRWWSEKLPPALFIQKGRLRK